MKALYKLQAKAWISNPFVKSEFLLSVVFLVVLSAMATQNTSNPDLLSITNLGIIGSIIALFTMNSAIYSFGFSFYEMKESVLLKRIGATKISKGGAIGSFVLWGMTSMAIMWVWILAIVGIASAVGPDVSGILYVSKDAWANIDWVSTLSGLIVTAISFLPIAFLFVSLAPNSEIYNSIATIYFMLVGFLGGSMTPNVDREWMNIISYMSPLGWSTNLVQNGLFGITEWTSAAPLGDWTSIGLVDLAIPLAYGAAAGLASAKFFKWD